MGSRRHDVSWLKVDWGSGRIGIKGWRTRRHTITLPECSHTLCIQLDDFFELNILDAQLLNQEGKNTLLLTSARMPKLEPIEMACLKLDGWLGEKVKVRHTSSDSIVLHPPAEASSDMI